MVRRYAHFSTAHLAPFADRLCALRVVDVGLILPMKYGHPNLGLSLPRMPAALHTQSTNADADGYRILQYIQTSPI